MTLRRVILASAAFFAAWTFTASTALAQGPDWLVSQLSEGRTDYQEGGLSWHTEWPMEPSMVWGFPGNPAIIRDSGRREFVLTWNGSGPAPGHVIAKISSQAFIYGWPRPDGIVSNGLGHQPVMTPDGWNSTGFVYRRLPVTNGEARVEVATLAEANTEGMAWAVTSSSVEPLTRGAWIDTSIEPNYKPAWLHPSQVFPVRMPNEQADLRKKHLYAAAPVSGGSMSTAFQAILFGSPWVEPAIEWSGGPLSLQGTGPFFSGQLARTFSAQEVEDMAVSSTAWRTTVSIEAADFVHPELASQQAQVELEVRAPLDSFVVTSHSNRHLVYSVPLTGWSEGSTIVYREDNGRSGSLQFTATWIMEQVASAGLDSLIVAVLERLFGISLSISTSHGWSVSSGEEHHFENLTPGYMRRAVLRFYAQRRDGRCMAWGSDGFLGSKAWSKVSQAISEPVIELEEVRLPQ